MQGGFENLRSKKGAKGAFRYLSSLFVPGMVTQLDRDVAGTLMNSSLGSIVSLSDQYNYDAFGRFDNHTHQIAGNTEYTLDMSYNKAGGIIQKDALATGITNFQDLNYTLDYSYVAGKPHQLESVFDQKSGITSDYIYNTSGSIKEIIDPGAGGPQQFYWNEEQWLSGVSNDLGVHHYVYDYKGERIMKSSVMQSAVQVNDQNIDDVQYLDPYTLYINPYYVVTELQGGDKISKHYYMNTQRVATDISINYQGPTPLAGPLQPNASDPKKPSADTASVNYNAAFADLQQTLEQFGKSKIDVDHLGTQPTLEAYFPELTKSKSSNGNGTESTTRVMFWYHPDYLGNVDLVTERDGKTYEFFTYNPWGEEMHQYNANTFGFASPYRFNSKEKDEESGLHYYGARYYQSKLSVWMSVDPLSKLNSHLTPFNFSSNNPIMRIDPNGLTDYSIDRTTGKITIVEGTETTDGLDRLIAGNATYENEKLTNSNFLEVRKGILEGGTPYTSGENIPFTLYGIVNNQEAKTMFEFVAVNSDVEWSLVNFTAESGDYNYLTTSGLVDGEAGGSQVAYEIAKEKEDGATLNSYYHSHPKSPFGVKYNWSGPSGLHVKDKHRSLNGGDGGDIGIAKKIIAHEPNAVFKIYDIRKMEYIPYDHKGIKR